MTKIKEHEDCETLWMELDFHKEHRFFEQILIAFNAEDKDAGPYISIVLYGQNKDIEHGSMWAQVFPNMEEVDIIIEALQQAKKKALEEYGKNN